MSKIEKPAYLNKKSIRNTKAEFVIARHIIDLVKEHDLKSGIARDIKEQNKIAVEAAKMMLIQTTKVTPKPAEEKTKKKKHSKADAAKEEQQFVIAGED